jgi:hypothetical protein
VAVDAQEQLAQLLLVENFQRFIENLNQFLPPHSGVFLRLRVLFQHSEGFQVLLREVPLALRVVNSQENILEALVLVVVINRQQNIVNKFFLGQDSVIQRINQVQQEKVGYFVGHHFFQGLLH